MKHLFAIITLIGFSILFSEILSGSTTLFGLLNPGLLLLLLLSYGCAILLIREYSIRFKLGIISIILLGIAYGIYNEGILAQTLSRETNLPIPNFNYYSYIKGINIGFSITITIWHALFSVLIPILLVHQLFPTKEPWLNKPALIIGSVLVFLLLPLVITKIKDVRMLIFIVTQLLLLVSAFFLRTYLSNGKEKDLRWKHLLIGFFIYLFLLFIPVLLATWHIPVLLYALYSFMLLALLLVTAVINKISQRTITFYGLGIYLGGILISFIFSGGMLQVITSILLATLVIHLAKKIKQANT